MKRYLTLVVLIVVFNLTACAPASTQPTATLEMTVENTATPLPSVTPYPDVGVILHQKDAQRTGSYDFPAIRNTVNVLWQDHLVGNIFGSPMYAGGLLYVCGSDKVYVFDAQTGAQLEPIRGIGMPFSPLAVAGNLLIGGGSRNRLLAYDRFSGEQIWSLSASGSIYNSPLIFEEVVYAVSERSAYALELQSGEVIWQMSLTDHRGFVGNPSYENGLLFVGVGNIFYALDGATGEIRWQVEGTSDQWFYSSALANGMVYVGYDDGIFYALDQQTGEQVWQSQVFGPGWSAPVVAGGKVYVGNRDNLMLAFDALTGEELWRFETVDWTISDPVFSNGTLYFGVGNHENREGPRPLYALDAETGQELWQFEADSRLMTAAALGPNAIYVVSITGAVYALK